MLLSERRPDGRQVRAGDLAEALRELGRTDEVRLRPLQGGVPRLVLERGGLDGQEEAPERPEVGEIGPSEELQVDRRDRGVRDLGILRDGELKQLADHPPVLPGHEHVLRGALVPVEERRRQTTAQEEVRREAAASLQPRDRLVEVLEGPGGVEAVEVEPAPEAQEEGIGRGEPDRLGQVGERLLVPAGQDEELATESPRLPEGDVTAGDRAVEQRELRFQVVLEV